jgi:glutathione synthase/RimK-type ligase-like ATP-grasp enzyme
MARLLIASTQRFDWPEVVTAENHGVETAARAAGIDAVVAPWHEPEHWRSLGPEDTVLIRTTWDYPEYPSEFAAWLDHLAVGPARVINPVPLIRWNLHKGYLLDLHDAGVPIVPARMVAAGTTVTADQRLVVKPTIGVGSVGAVVVEPGESVLAATEALVTPFIETVTDGELSIFVVADRVELVVRKIPAAGEWRVQEQWGGTTVIESVPPPDALCLATDTFAAVSRIVPAPPLYARIDLLLDPVDGWRVLEVEAIEPALFVELSDAVPRAIISALR